MASMVPCTVAIAARLRIALPMPEGIQTQFSAAQSSAAAGAVTAMATKCSVSFGALSPDAMKSAIAMTAHAVLLGRKVKSFIGLLGLYRKPVGDVSRTGVDLIGFHTWCRTHTEITPLLYGLTGVSSSKATKQEHHVMVKREPRAAFYLRVSTSGQTTDNQRQALQAVAEQRGWAVAQVFEDAGISGAKGRDKRPGLDALLKAVTRGEINLVMAWSIDRLGRSLQDLVGLMNEIRAAGGDLYLHQQAVDTTTPAGKALLQMSGVFAEFERSMIVDRVNAGLARARAEGKQLGRPKIAAKTESAIRVSLKRKNRPGLQKIAAEHGVGVGTVQRVLAELKAA